MRVAVFDTHKYDKEALERVNAQFGHTLHFIQARLTEETAKFAACFLPSIARCTGRIGAAFARIMHGFGCKLLAFDQKPDETLQQELGVQFVPLQDLFSKSDVISLHVPLTPKTHHLLNAEAFASMKRGVVLINTGRGGLIETKALISGLKNGTIGAAGLDVYEEEEGVFFSGPLRTGVARRRSGAVAHLSQCLDHVAPSLPHA